jgi:7-cyano-7-deazaguanine reductase
VVDQTRTLLGKTANPPKDYSPEILQVIGRSEGRVKIGISAIDPPFYGADQWTMYELSWLDNKGTPQVGIGEMTVPCISPNIVESKSLKLYLNSLNESRFASRSQVGETITSDLSSVVGAEVTVSLFTLEEYSDKGLDKLAGICLDNTLVECHDILPNPQLLSTSASQGIQDEALYSHLLKTNCPVTGQPDWASIQINYTGAPINHSGLLAYIVSYRHHHAFHEQCIENIYLDILKCCKPQELTVMARYNRRGGIDINPWRSSGKNTPRHIRLGRQ